MFLGAWEEIDTKIWIYGQQAKALSDLMNEGEGGGWWSAPPNSLVKVLDRGHFIHGILGFGLYPFDGMRWRREGGGGEFNCLF